MLKFLSFVIKAIVKSPYEGLLQQLPSLCWKNTKIKQPNSNQMPTRQSPRRCDAEKFGLVRFQPSANGQRDV